MNYVPFSYTKNDLRLLPARTQESHKYTYGRVLCVCGSVGMAGAAYLAAKSVLRMGAGLVEILTPEQNRTALQTLLPEAIVTPYEHNSPDTDKTEAALTRADAIVVGCGLGVTATGRLLLSCVLRNTSAPTVLDADALNLLSKNPSLLKYAKGKIITPHMGEMSRLCGLSAEQIASDAPSVCRDFASKHDLVCVLKSHRTCVSDGGERVYINNAGNSGMATAGAGDVLAGIIGGILAQNRDGKLTNTEVASLGVYIHSLAGDTAAARLGEYSLMASDIIDALPLVTKMCHSAK